MFVYWICSKNTKFYIQRNFNNKHVWHFTTSFQKFCIFGHSQRQWYSVPLSSKHLEHTWNISGHLMKFVNNMHRDCNIDFTGVFLFFVFFLLSRDCKTKILPDVGLLKWDIFNFSFSRTHVALMFSSSDFCNWDESTRDAVAEEVMSAAQPIGRIIKVSPPLYDTYRKGTPPKSYPF